MDPQQLLQRMCERHGLPERRADRLLPLIRRALVSPQDVRDRILQLVDQSLARQAAGDPKAGAEQVFEDLDSAVLLSVAKLLHNWAPSSAFLDLPGDLGSMFRPEDDPAA